jgi:ribosome-associated translation inhibitor RaiA
MKVDVRFHALESSAALRDYAVQRAHTHLDRFDHELTLVVVRIGDINGPRGSLDKRCRVTVHGRRIGSSTLDELRADPYAAVEVAIDRVAEAVARQIARARSGKHGPSVRVAS